MSNLSTIEQHNLFMGFAYLFVYFVLPVLLGCGYAFWKESKGVQK